MKLFILGNGFDLFHGLETTFTNFSNYFKSKNSDTYNYFTDVLEINESWEWNIIEEKLHKKFSEMTIEQHVECRRYLTLFSNELALYLQIEEEKMEIKNLDELKIMENSFAITFNYTSTLDKYFSEYIHIHDSEFPIIGFYDDESLFKDYKNFNDFLTIHARSRKKNELITSIDKHNIACIDDRITTNKIQKKYAKLIEKLSDNDINEIVIFGHSFGESDKLLLQYILKSTISFSKIIYGELTLEDLSELKFKITIVDRFPEKVEKSLLELFSVDEKQKMEEKIIIMEHGMPSYVNSVSIIKKVVSNENTIS